MNYRIGSKVREVFHVGGDAGEHGGGSDERVIKGDNRRQVGDLQYISIGRLLKGKRTSFFIKYAKFSVRMQNKTLNFDFCCLRQIQIGGHIK
jgi:hypothetical protein